MAINTGDIQRILSDLERYERMRHAHPEDKEEMWEMPDHAEMEYARATMPGKAYGHVIAVRAWDLAAHGLGPISPELIDLLVDPLSAPVDKLPVRLEAVASFYKWPARVPCIGVDVSKVDGSGRTRAPISIFGPGVYAFKHEVVHRHDVQKNNRPLKRAAVVGEVALWGPILEYEDGYRARYAYPTRLCVPGASVDLERCLYGAYGCEIITGEAEAKEYLQGLGVPHQNRSDSVYSGGTVVRKINVALAAGMRL